MRRALVTTLAAAAALVPLACSGGDDEDGAAGLEKTEETAAGGSAERSAAADAEQPEGGGGGSLPSVGPRVIQTASLTVLVPRDSFDARVEEARSLAAGLGGFVVSSTAAQGADRRLVRGTLVLRVPARSYAEAMEALAGLGRVDARRETGQDVSQELVDLEARARHLEAVERQLLELLGRARTVAAALAVQSRLNEVQLQLEQTRGRLRYLDDQVTFATISLSLREHLAAKPDDDGRAWWIVEAWERAARGFAAVAGWTLVAVVTVAPIVLVLALVLLGVRLARRRVVRA